LDISTITVHSNKEDYSPLEAIALEQAYKTLVAKSQGEEITLDETRIIVAYKRYQQEGNFKIVAEKTVRAKKEKVVKEPKEPKPKKQKALTKKETQLLLTMRDLLHDDLITLDSVPAEQREFYELNKDRV
jgi:hypothetical protein